MTHCPSCRRDNRDDAAFCDRCGTALRPFSYTPRHLAEKILQSKAAIEGERKQVTVLFADVKGSMELAEQLDPEAWHRIMDRFLHILAEGVHRFEGTVNQYTGDGIMALFGAPIAHEDHAQRACYAALHLRQALRRYADDLRVQEGLSFSVRMGLNSGEVVVGKIGDDLRMDYTAQGHVVGLAARMEQLAEPGKALLTEHTAKLVADYFALRDLGPSRVKGASAPLRLYELSDVGGYRTRFDVAQARGLSRFVGRADSTAALEEALSEALAGRGQVVGVVADAGTGKSRLCFEFASLCRARGMAVHEARAVAHGKRIPLLPVLDLLRDLFGVTPQDADAAAREKVAGRLLLLARDLDGMLPLLFDFLGIAEPGQAPPQIDPEARQRRLVEVTRRVIEGRTRGEGAVVVLEDLHWLDAASEAFVEDLVPALAGVRALLVVNFRPEYRADWMRLSHHRPLPIQPLGAEAADELLRELLGTGLADLEELIRERTGGNPFFIEEAVRDLIDRGVLAPEPDGARGLRLTRPVTEIRIPATVQAVLAARIDRLGAREKDVLYTAAVLGKELDEPVLRRVVELLAGPDGAGDVAALPEALRALVQADLLFEAAMYPEARFAFRHPLTQESAYRAQLGDRRARTHAAVARALGEHHAVGRAVRAETAAAPDDKLDEHAALLAHHWEAAGEPLEAARWHRLAAQWAQRTNLREAGRHWQQVRALAGGVEGAEAAELTAGAAAPLFYVASRTGGLSAAEAEAVFDSACATARAAGNHALLAATMLGYGRFRRFCLGDAEAQIRLGRQAAEVAEAHGLEGIRLAANLALASSLPALGRLAEAEEVLTSVIDHPPADPNAGSDVTGFSPYIWILGFRGFLRCNTGNVGGAELDTERAWELAQRHPSAELCAWTDLYRGRAARERGDAELAIRCIQQALAVAVQTGNFSQQTIALSALGETYLDEEQWPDAIAALEEVERTARDLSRDLPLPVSALATLALAYAHNGDPERGTAMMEKALAKGAIHSADRTIAFAQLLPLRHAQVLLATRGAEAGTEIERALDEQEAIVAQTGIRMTQPSIHLVRADLARARGDEDTRQRELRQAQRLFVEMGAPKRAERLARELSEA